jgi:hypothetical protein
MQRIPNRPASSDYPTDLATIKRILVKAAGGMSDMHPLVGLVQLYREALFTAQTYRHVFDFMASDESEGDLTELMRWRRTWDDERERAARFGKLCLDAGVDERQVRIAEREATAWMSALTRVAERMGLDAQAQSTLREELATEILALERQVA